MNKSKKMIIIVSILISLILIITGITILITTGKQTQSEEESDIQENYDTSKLFNIKEKLQNSKKVS